MALGAGQAIVVLLTPDDVAYLRSEYATGEHDPDTTPLGQARPNVLFEAGMAMGRDPKRTVLVELGRLRPFSDIAGRLALRMDNTLQRRMDLAQRLRRAGCSVKTAGQDWLTAGDFAVPPPVGAGIARGTPSDGTVINLPPVGAGIAPDRPSGTVINVTEETFNTEVVERSGTTPVILDCWAEWCGPCKQLSPVLEKLAVAADGAWVLAKMDTDANPHLQASLQVQSIPMVIAIVGGQVVDSFLGAIPEAQVRQWIGQVMQVASQMGLPGAGSGPGGKGQPDGGMPADRQSVPADPGTRGGPGVDMLADPMFDEARQAMERGDLDAAADAFQRVLTVTPGHPVATLGLAQVNLIRRVNSYDESQVRRAAAENPGDVTAQVRVADLELATGRVEEAFDRLFGVIRRTSGEDRDRARVHLIGLFEVFPPGDPRVVKARTTLSSAING